MISQGGHVDVTVNNYK